MREKDWRFSLEERMFAFSSPGKPCSRRPDTGVTTDTNDTFPFRILQSREESAFSFALRTSDYFLKRFSNAARASVGLGEDVSRSTVVRGAKYEQSFLPSFLGMRAVIGRAHSKRAAGSKYTHCLQLCNSKPQRGHLPRRSISAGSTVPHPAQRTTERLPGIEGVRGPMRSGGGPAFFSDRSRSRSES
jgi:hypothetical protein